jgi:hypothetical protein
LSLTNSCHNTLSTLLYEWIKRGIKRRSRTAVKCLQGNLPSSSLPSCTPSPAHATATAVVVVAGATVAFLHSLSHHHRLRRLHARDRWSSPRPLPSTDWHTDRWNPRTPTPLHGVVGAGRVTSTVENHVPTGLQRRMGPRNRVIIGGGGRRRKR